jgi:hypothetical protein
LGVEHFELVNVYSFHNSVIIKTLDQAVPGVLAELSIFVDEKQVTDGLDDQFEVDMGDWFLIDGELVRSPDNRINEAGVKISLRLTPPEFVRHLQKMARGEKYVLDVENIGWKADLDLATVDMNDAVTDSGSDNGKSTSKGDSSSDDNAADIQYNGHVLQRKHQEDQNAQSNQSNNNEDDELMGVDMSQVPTEAQQRFAAYDLYGSSFGPSRGHRCRELFFEEVDIEDEEPDRSVKGWPRGYITDGRFVQSEGQERGW